MFITINDGVKLHWWGDHIIIYAPEFGYYLMDESESFFIKQINNGIDLEELTHLLTFDSEITLDDARHFVNAFCENFSMAFDISQIKTQIKISGREGYYYPMSLHISLTSECPQNCIHCYKNAGYNKREIEYRDLSAFLSEMKGFVPELILSGGEPLLYSGFNELLRNYSDDFDIGVFTSGYIPIADNAVIKQARLGITVSVYSSDPKRHDQFVRKAGSFQKVIETVKYAVHQDIPVSINTNITNKNKEDIICLIKQMDNAGVNQVTVGRITPVGRAKAITDDSFFVTNSDYMRICNELREISPIVNVEDEVKDPLYLPLELFHCPAGTLSWSITEEGFIVPCGMYTDEKFNIGDIHNYSALLTDERAIICDRLQKYTHYNSNEIFRCPFR